MIPISIRKPGDIVPGFSYVRIANAMQESLLSMHG